MIKGTLNILLICLLFLSSLGITIYRLKDSEFLVEQARNVNTYNRLLNNIDLLVTTPEGKEQLLSKEELKTVIGAGIDGNTFYDFLGGYTKAYLDYLTGSSERLYFVYDLEPAITRSKNKAVELELAKYDNLPICKADELRTWSKPTITCRLSGTSSTDNDIRTLVSQPTDELFKDVPANIEVKEINQSMQDARTKVMLALNVIRGIVGVTALLLIVYLAIYRRKAYLALTVIFALVGSLQLLFNLYVWDWLVENAKGLLSGGDMQLAAPIVTDLATTLAQLFKATLGTISIVFLATAVFFLVLAILGFIYGRVKPIAKL